MSNLKVETLQQPTEASHGRRWEGHGSSRHRGRARVVAGGGNDMAQVATGGRPDDADGGPVATGGGQGLMAAGSPEHDSPL